MLDYDGPMMISELSNGGGSIARRYVFGPGDDAPLVWYEGAGTGDRRWLIPDERGSIVAVTNVAGSALALNSYDEYGVPGSANLGRFQYTGQAWIPELGMHYYKARIYNPALGRFMQTDPIGYADGINWYTYVRNDPVDRLDAKGLWSTAAHNVLIDYALRGTISNNALAQIKSGSKYVDRFSNQFGGSYQHAMRGPFESKKDADWRAAPQSLYVLAVAA